MTSGSTYCLKIINFIETFICVLYKLSPLIQDEFTDTGFMRKKTFSLIHQILLLEPDKFSDIRDVSQQYWEAYSLKYLSRRERPFFRLW